MKITYNLDDIKPRKVAEIGIHIGRVKDVKYNSKSKNSDFPNFQLTWELCGNGNDADDVVIPYDYLSLSPNAAWKLDEFMDATEFRRTCTGCGESFTKSKVVEGKGSVCPHCNNKTPLDINVGDNGMLLHGLQCRLQVGQEPSQKNPEDKFNRVEKYLPLN